MNQFNILAGKKWCACGDSFTHGDFTGLEESEKYIEEGRYKGQYKVYPYLIGNRNDMDIVMNAYNGASIAECGRKYDQTFVRGHYKDIPLDSNYITLYFGINDWHQHVPVGNIDDKDPETFYGAWNIVMEYLLTNYPFAHIGIIITNGINTGNDHSYTDAERNIARRWGIPYLDMEQGNVPLVHRVDRDGVCQYAKDIRMKNFIVSAENKHPNPKAHAYESTFIENFLRSL